MSDDLDHDAADELWRSVEGNGPLPRQGQNRAPLSLPPMDLAFRHASSNEPSPRPVGDEQDTQFGPTEDRRDSLSGQQTADRTPPADDEHTPVDKPSTGLRDFDVVVEKRSLIDRARDYPHLLIGGAAVLAIVVVAGTAIALTTSSGDDAGTYAASAQDAVVEVSDPESGSVAFEPTWKTAPAKLFSWHGDALSDIATAYEPIIGHSDFRYYWNVDSGTPVDLAVAEIAESVRNGSAGDLVVFAYGNSEDVNAVQLSELRAAVGDRALVLVGTGTSDPAALPWSSQLNARFQKLAAERPNTYYVDWQSRVTADPRTVERGFILTEQGTHDWAGMINSAILQAYR